MLRSPFPWFGGKSRVAAQVWARFGDVQNYIEPFFGSGAVLLGRPHPARVETVNDRDAFLANFWRALQYDPEAVARHADWPVNEADLHARHKWLVDEGRARLDRILDDPDFYDAKIAGWWVWGQCMWIGSGWCQPRAENYGRAGDGSRQRRRPQLGGQGGGSGVHAPRLSNKRMILGGNGNGIGVHSGQGHLSRQLPDLGGDGGAVGRGIHASALDKKLQRAGMARGLYDWFDALADRMRRTRVTCGDWTRVLTPAVTTYIGVTGVFLDPPYLQDLREMLYSEDHDVSADVRAWAIEHGDNPKMRIALCGYEGEHDMPASWEVVKWKAHGGYSRSARGKANRKRERIWFSPACLRPGDRLPFESPEGDHATVVG